jgi:hypothetical protein
MGHAMEASDLPELWYYGLMLPARDVHNIMREYCRCNFGTSPKNDPDNILVTST